MSTPKSSGQGTRVALPRNRKELLATLHDRPAPPDIVKEAQELKESTLATISTRGSVLASLLYSKCYHHIPTTAIDTMAVTLLADRTSAFLYNPYFTKALGLQGALFVMMHEARHLLYRHLFNEETLRVDPVFTTATEVGINHDVMVTLNTTDLPKVAKLDKDGNVVLDAKGNPELTPTGIDPRGVYDKYVKDLTDQGVTPVSYEDFVRTDMSCYTELKRMKNPPKPGQSLQICLHGGDGTGSGAPGDGDDGEGVPMDGETADQIGKEALRVMMTNAVNGSERAADELRRLADRTEDASERTGKLWGDLGIGRLRGQTLASRKVDWWKQWVNDQLASRLVEGERLIYNKKRGVLDLLLGHDPMLSHRGREEHRVVLVAIDTSGSMYSHVIEWLTKLVGHTDGVEFRWVSFDGVVMPFQPGEPVLGGGGTNFANVMDYAEGRTSVNGHTLDIHPDAVLMVTDGGAPAIRPAEPDKWIWLITENGDDGWIRAQADPMASYRITTGDGVTAA